MKTYLSILACVAMFYSAQALASDTPPSLDPKGCKFEYPKAALLTEEQGAVSVKVTVDNTGKVTDAKVINSSNSKTLDRATVSVLNTCKFKPAVKDGKPAEATTVIVYEWKLN